MAAVFDRKLDMFSTQSTGMNKCACGREARSFEACSPMGCTTFFVCLGCHKETENCSCSPT